MIMKPDYENRMKWIADPETYRHLIKTCCVVCDTPIESTGYENNGNFCEKCCVRATSMAHRRIWEKRDMDELMGVYNFKQAVRSVLV